MSRRSRSLKLAGLAAGGAIALAIGLAGSPAMAATPAPAGTSVVAAASLPADAALPAGTTEVIEVPMTYTTTTTASTSSVQPDVRITGNCGTAFLYIGTVNGEEEHVDFGFEDLDIHAIWVSGNIDIDNEDTGYTNHKSWSGATAFVTSWEKQANLETEGGEVTTYGSIVATGTLSDCTSAGLYTTVYV